MSGTDDFIDPEFQDWDDDRIEHKMHKWCKSYNKSYDYCVNSYDNFEKLIRCIRILEHTLNIPSEEKYVEETHREDFNFYRQNDKDMLKNHPSYKHAMTHIKRLCTRIYDYEEYMFQVRTRICNRLRQLSLQAGSEITNWGEINDFLNDHSDMVNYCS